MAPSVPTFLVVVLAIIMVQIHIVVANVASRATRLHGEIIS
jgi:hypothetical protein